MPASLRMLFRRFVLLQIKFVRIKLDKVYPFLRRDDEKEGEGNMG